MSTPPIGSVWHHRNGGVYTISALATHTETADDIVIYTDKDGRTWARPLKVFIDGRFVKQNVRKR